MYYSENTYKQRSTIRSTSHKNWLTNLISLEKLSMTSPVFNITKKNGEKRVVTMVKTDKLDSKKRSGISPFLYTPEVWPEDAATQNIETTENGNKLKSKMRVLEGGEVPKQYMIWLKDYKDKIFNNISLSAPAKLGFLRRLVTFEAQIILSQVEYDYLITYVEPSAVSLLNDYKI